MEQNSIQLCPTKQFNVFETSEHATNRSIDLYAVESDRPFASFTEKEVVHNLVTYGCCVRKGIISESTLASTRAKLNSFAKKLIARYDALDDEFCDVDADQLCIERMPRIGRGKHNIHFDPQLSPQHEALVHLAEEAGLSATLTRYMGRPCSLRETGISLTRPLQPQSSSSSGAAPSAAGEEEAIFADSRYSGAGGEGMEWHSDGAAGEATVLLALDDVEAEMGALRVVPRSHLRYVPGVGHTEEALKGSADWLAAELVSYPYRAGEPMMIDARTLHSVSANVSDRWRMVVWFIFDSY